MYIIRKCSNFILLHAAVQFSQHHLLKRPYHGFYSFVLSSQISGEKKKNQNLREEKNPHASSFHFVFPPLSPTLVFSSLAKRLGSGLKMWVLGIQVSSGLCTLGTPNIVVTTFRVWNLHFLRTLYSGNEGQTQSTTFHQDLPPGSFNKLEKALVNILALKKKRGTGWKWTPHGFYCGVTHGQCF